MARHKTPSYPVTQLRDPSYPASGCPQQSMAFLNNTKTERLYTTLTSTYPGATCDFYCTGAYDDVWLAALATLQVGSYNGLAYKLRCLRSQTTTMGLLAGPS